MMKILVALIEHIGDIIACEPVARYLKKKFPESNLTWIISRKFRPLVAHNPFIDHVIEVECLTDWIKIANHTDADLVVDLHVNYRVCECCRIPLIKRHGNPFVSAYEWLDYGPLLQAFSIGAGLPPISAAPKIYLPEHVLESVSQLNLAQPYCVIHRTSNSPIKDWTDEKWAELVRKIKENHGIDVIEIGNAKTSESSLGNLVTNLINKTDLLETGAVIRGARFFIGIDSGPAHMANAQKVPGVILLGQHGAFKKYNPYTGYYAESHAGVKIVQNLSGSVADLSVTQVVEAVSYVNSAVLAGLAITPEDERASLKFVSTEHRDLVQSSGLFDEAWYELHTEELAGGGIDPLTHYLSTDGSRTVGTLPGFDAAWYSNQYPQVASIGAPPIVHYLQNPGNGRRYWQIFNTGANWTISRTVQNHRSELFAVSNSLSPDSLSRALDVESPVSDLVTRDPKSNIFPRTFAFYLPQFHPIDENNWAHGLGFTEWHNVTKAKPLFAGHYQPKIPGELGYYDLRSPLVLQKQIELARSHGIDGFCFYYYYFAGKKILYDPIEEFLKSDSDMPFLFMWANENWSKRWDGGDKEVIIAQEHSDFDDMVFINGLFDIFRDPRYVKIDGKPVLMIYKTHLFPNILNTTERWREAALKNGFPGLYLIKADGWIEGEEHPRFYGFDASYEIPSNVTPENVEIAPPERPLVDPDFEGRLIDYQKFASFHAGNERPDRKRFKTVMLPWDNTARYKSRGIVHLNIEGSGYENWLSQALMDTYVYRKPEERIVFLHSWNEWCEGTYLEPDAKYGRRRLENTKNVIFNTRRAISLAEGSGVAAELWKSLFDTQRTKDEGAFLALDAARREARYVWTRLSDLEATERVQVDSPQIPTKKELKLLIKALKIKRFFVLPFKKKRRHQAEKIERIKKILMLS